MYMFCYQRGLREVWGYMWTAWYCPEKYKLWARSTQPDRIGHWRTTMAVENFWRNLKHDTLRNLLRPRLDQLVFLIATEILPSFTAKMQIFDPNYRSGRAPELTPFQAALKRNWKKLSMNALGARNYSTNVQRWTCDCGQQKYNAYLLCKHLVQAVAPPPPNFFTEVVRRRVIPFYNHPSLKFKDGSTLPKLDFTCSVSNGDPIKTSTTSTPASPRGVKRKRRAPKPLPPIEPCAEDMEIDGNTEWLKQRITDIKAGVAMMEQQAENPRAAKMWVRSMKRANIGKDITEMARDVRHFTETGHKRPTTWAKQGNKASERYTRNTMGYYEAK
ncbi:hypothetical protein GGX14DRAFT_537218 [Mycena pura]|uniref:SWIM-type domain-containing protein n=1 Tax=Mycena pura TaxID=153505 RepID=A0AAD6Y0R5_9AGAR|nr:hypothetical protein GGX14DRAFT_537218 [Mycena pura]